MRLVQLQNEQPKLERMVHATLDELAMRSIKLVWGDGNFTNLDGNVITIDKAWDKDELKSLVKVLSLVRHELVHTHPINLEFKQDMSENDFRNQLMPKLRAAEVAAVYVELGTIATAARLLGKDPLEFLGEPALFPLFQVFEAHGFDDTKRRESMQFLISQSEPVRPGETYESLWLQQAQERWRRLRQLP